MQKPIDFELLGMCFYEKIGKRMPRKGEYYLSGAIVQAYRAPNALTFEYQIVRPTHAAERVLSWRKGRPY